jgi:hypothetical protein
VNNIGAQYTGDGTSGIYLWGAQLSDSASLDTYVPNYGAAPTAAAYYGPRLDADPVTLAQRGLLVEELRANLALNSEDWAGWSVNTTNNGVTVNTAVSPSGASTADLLFAKATNAVHVAQQSITVVSTTNYVATVYVKAGGYSKVGIRESAATGANATFNLSTGALISQGNGGTGAISSVGNGWYRISMSSAASGTSFIYTIYVLDNAYTSGDPSSYTFTGDGASGLYLYGAQLEAGSFATSYIPVGATTAGATRNADVASVSTQAFPYGATEGTVVINASVLTVSNPNTAMLYSFYADASNFINSFIWSGAPSTPRGTVTSPAGADQANLTAGTVSANTAFKTAFGFKASDFGFSLNGSAASTDGTGTMPSTSAKLELGAQASGTLLSGHIRQITYLPRRISNTELQTRTA